MLLQVCWCDWTGRSLRSACIDWESGRDNWTSYWSTARPTNHQEGQVNHNNTTFHTIYHKEVYQYSTNVNTTNSPLTLMMPLFLFPSADVLKWEIRNVISIQTSDWFCTLSWQTHTINLRSRLRLLSSTSLSHETGSRTSCSQRWSTWRDQISNIWRCVCTCLVRSENPVECYWWLFVCVCSQSSLNSRTHLKSS